MLFQFRLLTKVDRYWEEDGVLFVNISEIRILRSLFISLVERTEYSPVTEITLKDGKKYTVLISMKDLLAELHDQKMTSWEHLLREEGL